MLQKALHHKHSSKAPSLSLLFSVLSSLVPSPWVYSPCRAGGSLLFHLTRASALTTIRRIPQAPKKGEQHDEIPELMVDSP